MVKTLKNPSNSLTIKHSKDKEFKVQYKKVFEGFFKQPQSMKMLSIKLKIDRANICWYCREFRKNNQLGIVKKAICFITKKRVNFYTTNPELFPKSNQTKLF
jgi:hypothetical protein